MVNLKAAFLTVAVHRIAQVVIEVPADDAEQETMRWCGARYFGRGHLRITL